MSLEQKDLELIEHIIFKNSDDIAISLARSFERLEKKDNDYQSRLYSRLLELEDKIESGKQDMSNTIREIKEEIRDSIRFKLDPDYERF